jgi:hypothetical protein
MVNNGKIVEEFFSIGMTARQKYSDQQMIQQGNDKSIKANWNLKEYYEVIREHIRHEDTLANERLKALFTVQTILFAAFAVLFKEPTGKLVLFLSLVGFLSALAYGIELFLGKVAIGNIMEAWNDDRDKHFRDMETPRMIGVGVFRIFQWLLPGTFVPLLFGLGWLWILISRYQPTWLPDWIRLTLWLPDLSQLSI